MDLHDGIEEEKIGWTYSLYSLSSLVMIDVQAPYQYFPVHTCIFFKTEVPQMGFDPKQKYRMIWYTNKNILVFAYKKLKWWEIIIENKQYSNIISMLKHINI